MYSIFHIGPTKQIDGNNRLWQVDLILIIDNNTELLALIKQIREEIYSVIEGLYRLGMLLIKLEQFYKVQEVYDILLNQTTADLEILKMDQGEYTDAITYCK
ncbi:unnamed protein product [Rotaria sp. Silwood2]|nr:unnamed protein product [Rotaria sp. Silwood2]